MTVAELACPECGRPAVIILEALGGYAKVRCLRHGVRTVPPADRRPVPPAPAPSSSPVRPEVEP